MRARWGARVTGFLLLATAVVWGAAPAIATPPVSLSAGFVTDAADVLTPADESTINTRLEALSTDDRIDLFVVFVDEFTSPSDRQQWADQVAADNGLGAAQYLLAVATEGRQYYISADSSGPVSESRLLAIEESIKPDLRAENWAGAAMTAAEAFSADDAGSSGWGFILVIVVIALAVILIVWLVSRSKKKRTADASAADDPYAGVTDEQLTTQAGAALVQADDAITSSREELGFATAQFGEKVTATFAQVITDAKAKVDEAFSLKQQLDDEIPDTDEQRRAWHIQIITLCEEADTLLDSNVEAFDELRQLEQNAEQALQRATQTRAETAAAVAAAPDALARLAQSYDASALSTIAENPAQAASRLELADAHLAEASALLAAGKRGEAAFAIRTAEEGLVQARQLCDAITTLGADLSAAEEQARVLMADLEGDIAAAGTLPDPSGQLAQTAAATRAQLDEARANLTGSARRPAVILEALTAANTRIDALTAQVRDAQQRAARASQMLAQTLLQAQAQVSAANEFIMTRRGAVGATARTRLAEASAQLSQAHNLQPTDPETALQHAARADSLAQNAIALAQQDVNGYGGLGGGFTGGGGSGIGGDILGGIIGGILASGGGRSSGSGWGGSSGGGWRSSGGSRGFRPSSFGGSRGRSGGGRF